jgi:fused signal recognition particle receptor
MFGFGKKSKKDTKKVETPVAEASQDSVEMPVDSQKDTSKKGWVSRLKSGLGKSSSQLNDGLKNIFTRKKLDDDLLEELEDLLISSDLGVSVATKVVAELAKQKFDKEVSVEDVTAILSEKIATILTPVAKTLEIDRAHKPYVIVMCGVNGAGKTTTIGKMAKQYQQQGYKVAVAACDTFRAAAVEQLEVWANRNDCQLFKGDIEADPASVAYQAMEKSAASGVDILFIDTAGRLQNKHNLMEQLAKIIRVIQKIDDTAPHSRLIVLDATTGQNANQQVKVFKEIIDINGMIVTKLDGTAKGGVVVSLADQFAMPVYAIGVGETIDDLQPFSADAFAKSLTEDVNIN